MTTSFTDHNNFSVSENAEFDVDFKFVEGV